MNSTSLADNYLRVVSDAYLLSLERDPEERLEVLLDRSSGKAQEAIGMLRSEYRKSEVIDSWSPLEIALFIAGITRFGRDWESIKSILPSKSAVDMSQFYYSVWKGSSMYSVWKKARKQRGLE
jgi:hypothetical protein